MAHALFFSERTANFFGNSHPGFHIVFVMAQTVAEAKYDFFFVQPIENIFLCIFGFSYGIKHIGGDFIGAPMPDAFEGSPRGNQGPIRIGHGRFHHHRREGRTVDGMIQIKNQDNIQGIYQILLR